MKPEEAKALIVCQNEAEAARLSEALQDIGLNQIRILVEECPNSAYATIIQQWDLDVVLTDTEFTGVPLLALTKLFPNALLLLLDSEWPTKKMDIQKAVLKHLQGLPKILNNQIQ